VGFQNKNISLLKMSALQQRVTFAGDIEND